MAASPRPSTEVHAGRVRALDSCMRCRDRRHTELDPIPALAKRGEETIAVAGLEQLAVRSGDTNSKFVWIDLAQFRDVGRDVARGVAAMLFVQVAEQGLEFVGDGLGHPRLDRKPRSG